MLSPERKQRKGAETSEEQAFREDRRGSHTAPKRQAFESLRKENSAALKGQAFASLRQMVGFALVGETLLLLLNALCYQDIIWLLPEQLLLFPGFRIWKRQRAARQERAMAEGFREFLQSLMTSLQAGYSLENACVAALSELCALYGKRGNPILCPLRKLVHGIQLNISLEQLFHLFARETQLSDASQLATVVEIARMTGGNMVEILRQAMEHMKAKGDTETEIRVLLSGKLFEKNIMLFMPFAILLYLNLTNAEYLRPLYASLLGHLLMSAVLAVTVACFFWSEKIMKVNF